VHLPCPFGAARVDFRADFFIKLFVYVWQSLCACTEDELPDQLTIGLDAVGTASLGYRVNSRSPICRATATRGRRHQPQWGDHEDNNLPPLGRIADDIC
jgi:hypothetical protein